MSILPTTPPARPDTRFNRPFAGSRGVFTVFWGVFGGFLGGVFGGWGVVSPAVAEQPVPSLIYRGCAETLPAGTFGCANAENLRRQAAVPSDLMQGRTPTPTLGVLDADAMNRLRNGLTKPLIGSGASDTFQGNEAATSGPAASNTGTP